MITLTEALHFRSLRYIRQELGPFHVLVGPNASGKTTFLDILHLLGRLVSDGLDAAVEERTTNFQDLVWRRSGSSFSLAIEARIPEERKVLLTGSQEARIPEERKVLLTGSQRDTVRYEVRLGLDSDSQETGILAEKVLLKAADAVDARQRTLFPAPPDPPTTILTPKAARNTKTVLNKVPGGNDNFYDETGKGWDHAFKLGPRRSALGNLPEDESKFPVSTWLKALLVGGIQPVVLNSLLIRRASPPGQIRGFKPDGSNLPWVIADLERLGGEKIQGWIAHLRTALPDLESVRTVERPDDKHRYVVLKYEGGLEIPSWMASDGTLRLMVLTLPAYLSGFQGVYLIDEPENGIHPRAVETMLQSLSSVYDAQILLATHSPVILSVVKPEQVLCFAKTPDGATDVIPGHRHPALQEWRGETNLGVLFAAGVLG